MQLPKIEGTSEKKKNFTEGFFSSKWKFKKKKESLQDEGVHSKLSYQRLPCISCAVT